LLLKKIVREHVNTRHFAAAVSLALAAPSCLVATNWFAGPSSGSLQLLALNWLYMATPLLLVVALSLLSVRFRSFATVPLVLLTLLLLCFQAWVWWWVPAREGARAWILYFPIALAVLLLALFGQLALRKRSVSVP
jgi:hypothetical protein